MQEQSRANGRSERPQGAMRKGPMWSDASYRGERVFMVALASQSPHPA